MVKRVPHFRSGFTLLEILLAMGVAMVVAAVAVPAMTRTWSGGAEGSRGRVEKMAREARERAVADRRPYVIRLRDRVLCLEPEHSGEKAEASHSLYWKLDQSASFEMAFPAALGAVEAAAACWTFWPDGTSEPVRVSYRDGHEAWIEVFDPLMGRREVSHD